MTRITPVWQRRLGLLAKLIGNLHHFARFGAISKVFSHGKHHT
jgi:hypothetical protein